MKSALCRIALVPAIAGILWFGGCSEQSGSGADLLGPDQSSLAKGGNGKEKEKGPKVKVHGRKTRGLTYTLAAGEWSDVFETQAQAVYTKGTELRIDLPGTGHYLVVPADAFANRALDGNSATFKLKATKRNATDAVTGERWVYLAVELKATAQVNGATVDVGSQGFSNDVDLYLDSSWARNISAGNNSRLEILWQLNSTTFAAAQCRQPIGSNPENPCVESAGRWVHARLAHFSNYALGMPD